MRVMRQGKARRDPFSPFTGRRWLSEAKSDEGAAGFGELCAATAMAVRRREASPLIDLPGTSPSRRGEERSFGVKNTPAAA
jgi:hypothetical protein